MTIGSRRFKRVVLGDAWLAAEIERNLEIFADATLFPPIVIRYEHELWLEYVDGTQPAAQDAGLVERVADFYATLYGREARIVPLADTRVPVRLQRDLQFLANTGVITGRVMQQLEQATARLAPDAAWIGFDYMDPVLKNFVAMGEGRLCAVDVEALCGDSLLGTGVARALNRWAEPYRASLSKSMSRAGVPDFNRYFAYVELAFLAAYTTIMVLERKWKFVQPTRFDRFLTGDDNQFSTTA